MNNFRIDEKLEKKIAILNDKIDYENTKLEENINALLLAADIVNLDICYTNSVSHLYDLKELVVNKRNLQKLLSDN